MIDVEPIVSLDLSPPPSHLREREKERERENKRSWDISRYIAPLAKKTVSQT